MRYVPSIKTTDVAPGAMMSVDVEGLKIFVANVGGQFFAMQRKCPHFGADLSKGKIEGNRVVCPMHGASFDLTDGHVEAAAKILFIKMQPKAAKTYPVRVEAEQVLVGLE